MIEDEKEPQWRALGVNEATAQRIRRFLNPFVWIIITLLLVGKFISRMGTWSALQGIPAAFPGQTLAAGHSDAAYLDIPYVSYIPHHTRQGHSDARVLHTYLQYVNVKVRIVFFRCCSYLVPIVPTSPPAAPCNFSPHLTPCQLCSWCDKYSEKKSTIAPGNEQVLVSYTL